MSLVMLAMLFMVEQRVRYQKAIPLLSCANVTTSLKSVLPRREKITEDEVLRQLGVRLKKRRDSIDAPHRKQHNDGILIKPPWPQK